MFKAFCWNVSLYSNFSIISHLGSKIIVEDDEWGEQNYTLELVKGSEVFFIKGNTLFPTEIFDYEKDNDKQWTVEITATDNGNPPLSVSLNTCICDSDYFNPESFRRLYFQ